MLVVVPSPSLHEAGGLALALDSKLLVIGKGLRRWETYRRKGMVVWEGGVVLFRRRDCSCCCYVRAGGGGGSRIYGGLMTSDGVFLCYVSSPEHPLPTCSSLKRPGGGHAQSFDSRRQLGGSALQSSPSPLGLANQTPIRARRRAG